MAQARIVNVSQSGALIRTHLPLSLLARVDIHVNARSISSFVTRLDETGIGVEWCESSTELTGILVRLPAPAIPSLEPLLIPYHAA